jgi:CRISPR/Cas system-associated exonuclease Cas4 (RecB family)
MKDYISVSASSLASFFRCSQMFKWQFLDERPVDEISMYTVYGSTLHKALELHFRYNFSLKEIEKAWPILLIAFFSEAKGLVFPDKHILDERIELGLKQIQNVELMKKRWEGYEILEVEKYVKIPFKNSFLENVFLTGRIDLLLRDITYLVCLDWKSSKGKEKDIENNVQLTFYSFFIRELYRYSLENIFGALAYPFDGEIIFTQRSDEDFSRLFNQINNMLERISKKDFIKEPKLNRREKDCFFCQYKKTCMRNVD